MTLRRPPSREPTAPTDGTDELPDTLTVRVVRITTECRRAWRRRRIELVTTLLDPAAYLVHPRHIARKTNHYDKR